MKIGVVGLGRLGRAMSDRLIDRGHDVVGWNRTPLQAASAGRMWTRCVKSLAELATMSEIVILVVRDDAALEDVARQLEQLPITGKTVLQMGTSTPLAVRQVAEALIGQGATVLDAPVSGTVEPAREGRLLVMIGGDAANLAYPEPVLSALSHKAIHVGPIGAASLLKLVINHILLVYWEALGEALAVGQAGGLHIQSMVDIIRESAAGLPLLSGKAEILVGRGGTVGFDMRGAQKDLSQIQAVARRCGVAIPAGMATARMVDAAIANGFADRDVAELVRFWIAQPSAPAARENPAQPAGIPYGS